MKINIVSNDGVLTVSNPIEHSTRSFYVIALTKEELENIRCGLSWYLSEGNCSGDDLDKLEKMEIQLSDYVL